VVAQLNGKESQKILAWFVNGLAFASGVEDESLLRFTTKMVREGEWTQEILRLAREADLGITGLSASDEPTGALNVRHRSFDSNGRTAGHADFRLSEESEGTQKFIALAGPLLFVFKNATALFLDELDARLHPRLTRAVVNLFHSSSNPNDAQLVAATHDTNLLDRRLLRRDQIWFTEKDPRGATKLYSLAEFDLDLPREARYERDYLLGKYGAVPVIGELVQPEPEK
jgi:predicted ATPase